MSFQPVLPLSGYAGWRFLQRTMETQKAAFTESSAMTGKADYFRENIAKIETAEDLVADRRLLEVALGAFGLQDDINNRFFIKKVLEEGTLDEDALANKLSDSRYKELSKAFGFAYATPSTKLSDFADGILARYGDRQFEVAVGEQDDDMRLALNFGTTIGEVVGSSESENVQWYAIMGNTPLRNVMQTALGFPSSFGQIDIDQQLSAFKSRAQSILGSDSPSDFSDPEVQEKILRLFMIRSELSNYQSLSGASAALTLLQAAG